MAAKMCCAEAVAAAMPGRKALFTRVLAWSDASHIAAPHGTLTWDDPPPAGPQYGRCRAADTDYDRLHGGLRGF